MEIPDDNIIKPPFGYDLSDSIIICVILGHYSLFIKINYKKIKKYNYIIAYK